VVHLLLPLIPKKREKGPSITLEIRKIAKQTRSRLERAIQSG